MCNALRCRLMVVLAVVLLTLMQFGGDRAYGAYEVYGTSKTQETTAALGGSSFGTFATAHALGTLAPTRGASWLHCAIDPAGRSSFGTFDPLRDDRRQVQRAASSGEGTFVRHFSRARGTIARRYWFDSS